MKTLSTHPIFLIFRRCILSAVFGAAASAVPALAADLVAPPLPSGIYSSTAAVVNSTMSMILSTSPAASAIDRRIAYERYARRNPFVLFPHRQNYILPLAYNFTPHLATFDTGNPGGRPQNAEVKFQLSIKVNVTPKLIEKHSDLYVAYTQLSFWQAFNTKNSSPFRETDYEPEAGAVIYSDLHFLGIRQRILTLAVSHQSNGRGGDSSRSWNRIFGEIMFQRGNAYLTLRPWYRIPETASNDDNPDIERFMGHGELYFNYVYGNHTFGIMTRNNFRSDNKSAVQADWTFPLVDSFKGYVQYFYGYGESLIDYNYINRRISVGFSLSGWI